MEQKLTTPAPDTAWAPLFGAWIVALVATLGALFIGEVMGQLPCDLCWHQRAFMFPLVVILAVASFRSDGYAWRYALPVALVGWLIAAFHNLVYFNEAAKGGHFAAWEEPELFSAEVRGAFRSLR